MPSVKVTGLGAVCANGTNKEKIFASCADLSSAIGENGLASLSARDLEVLSKDTPEHLRKSKCTVLSFHSLTAALSEAGWTTEDLKDCGFIFASTTSQIDQWEKDLPFYRRPDRDEDILNYNVVNQSLGQPLGSLAKHFGVHGPHALLASSCSASLQALTMASLWIRSGKVKRCLVGATEIQNDLTGIGFNSLRLLSKTNCSPFDKNRTGINLGEGSAFLCLEEASLRQSPKTWGFLTGTGLATDAYHPTAPHPEGKGSQISMRMALNSAKLEAAQVDWIYAHGTGSPANDLAESKAILQVFPQNPPVSSTKSSHGHTLGACGALESALGLMAMQKDIVLPTFNFKEADPQIPNQIASRPMNRTIRHFLKNSLGFGGINVSVIFSKEEVTK